MAIGAPPVGCLDTRRGRAQLPEWPVVDIAEAINYKPAAIESADGRRLRR